jgi:transcriptional regulator
MARSVPPDLLPGTLDLLILRLLARETMHGYGIAQRLKVLYPALQRLLLNGYVDAEWGPSENNRRARYYTLTKAGRKHLSDERAEFNELVSAIQRVMEIA